MKTRVLLGTVLSATLLTTAALGDDQQCLGAVAKGQRFMKAHKLVEASEHLRICAAVTCPVVVQADCARWLDDVEKALPSVVLAARNASGADLIDVKVSADGQRLVGKLDGQAVSINAGVHLFHFEGADGTSLDEQVLVKEGEKNREIVVTLRPSSSGSSSEWKTMGWVLAGLGLTGLGAAGLFGVIAILDKDGAHCHSNGGGCDPGSIGGIRNEAIASNAGWIAGGALLAGGAALLLLSPSGDHHPGGGVGVTPVVTSDAGGVVVKGVW
jgi:hypothetical protein